MNGARYRYLDTIYKLIKQGEDIVFVSSDYAAPSLDKLKKDFPDRYVSVGIAEQNLIQIACGLAMAGRRVIAYGMAPFPCIRAYDQIKNAVAMMNLPVNIVSVGTGFAIPEFGATHYCAEDFSIMRTIPNMEIITISDEWMAEKCANYSLKNQGPLYVRFDKYCDGILYDERNNLDWESGFAIPISEGDFAVITNSYYVSRIQKLAALLKEKWNISITLIDMFRMPFDKEKVIKILNRMKGIITVEEHIYRGGLGSEILELLVENYVTIPIHRIAIDFDGEYPQVYGNRKYILEQYSLSDDNILQQLAGFIRSKMTETKIKK